MHAKGHVQGIIYKCVTKVSVGVTGQIKALVGIPDTTDQIETVKEGYWACSYGVRLFDRCACLKIMRACACIFALVYAESSAMLYHADQKIEGRICIE